MRRRAHGAVAALIAVGFLASSIFGAKLALNLPEAALRRVFALFLMAIALRIDRSPGSTRPAAS